MRLLLVEDERKVAAFVKRGVEQELICVVDVAHDGEEGALYAKTYEYDAIILDLMLPQKDGLEVLSDLRACEIHAPVMLLTARDSIESKVQHNRSMDLTRPKIAKNFQPVFLRQHQ